MDHRLWNVVFLDWGMGLFRAESSAPADENQVKFHRVSTANEANDVLSQGTYDACLVGHTAGRKDALEFIRSRPSAGERARLILVVQNDRRAAALALEAGASDYVDIGDWDTDSLVRSIRHASDRASTLEEQAKLTLNHENHLYDDVTGLPNRLLFEDRLAHALARIARDPTRHIALVVCDLDRFKNINESLGHSQGHHLLSAIKERFFSVLRPMDTLARPGGDEFWILADNLVDGEAASKIARRLLDSLQMPFCLEQEEFFVTASFGVVTSVGYTKSGDFLRDGESAMYQAKSRGGGQFVCFEQQKSSSVATLSLESELRRALERHELTLEYQPIVALDSLQISGFEVLLRWQHPVFGFLLPVDFLNIAEETGLIIPISEWVIRESAKQVRTWQKLSPKQSDLKLNINISPVQLCDSRLLTCLASALKESGFPPQHLNLEIKENVLSENALAVRSALSQLKQLGLKIHMDNFGTGYTSLGLLHLLPLDTLKIDRSFIAPLSNSEDGTAIVQTIVALARNLGMDVAAMGIETEAQVERLRALDCTSGQGYFFSKPLGSAGVTELLLRERAA